MPQFHCNHCGQHINADDSYAGMAANCPSCGGDVVVPSAAPAPAPQVARPPAPSAWQPPRPQYQQPRPQHAAYTPEPPPRRVGIGAFFTSPALWATIVVAGVGVGLAYLVPIPTFIEAQPGIPPLAYALGFVLGIGVISLVAALILAGILAACKLSFTKSLSRTYAISVVLLAALGALLLVGMRGLEKTREFKEKRLAESQATREAMEDVRSDLKQMINEVGSQGDELKPIDLRFKTDPKAATTDAERMRDLMRGFFNDMIALQNNYIASLEKSGFMKLMDADRMYKDEGLKESRVILAEAKKVVQEFRTRADKLLTGFPQRIEEASLGSASSASMRLGFEQGLKKSLPQFQEAWDIEVSVVGHVEEVLALMEQSHGHWAPENGQFLFERDADLQAFNKIMGKITAGVSRQEAIRSQSMKNAANAAEKGL